MRGKLEKTGRKEAAQRCLQQRLPQALRKPRAWAMLACALLAFCLVASYAAGAAYAAKCSGELDPWGKCDWRHEPYNDPYGNPYYFAGCYACGGGGGHMLESEVEVSPLRGDGYNTVEKVNIKEGTKVVEYYVCYNCGVVEKNTRLVRTKYYKRDSLEGQWEVDDANFQDGIEDGPYGEASGYVPYWRCTLEHCQQEAYEAGSPLKINHIPLPDPTKPPTPTAVPTPTEVPEQPPTPEAGKAVLTYREEFYTNGGLDGCEVSSSNIHNIGAEIDNTLSLEPRAYNGAVYRDGTISIEGDCGLSLDGSRVHGKLTGSGTVVRRFCRTVEVTGPTGAPEPTKTPKPTSVPKPTPPPHVHNWIMIYDDTSHWEVCGCGQTQNYGSHRLYQLPLGHGCTEERCSVCGYIGKKTHVHDFSGRWLYGDTNHWKECQWPCCRLAGESAPHSFWESTEGGYIISTCGVCGYTMRRPVKYGVAFNGNHPDAQGSMAVQGFVYDAPQALEANAYSLTYTATYHANAGEGERVVMTDEPMSAHASFAGWADAPDAEARYRDGETVRNLSETDGGRVTLYAVWEYGSLVLRSAERTGYRLTGWNTEADGSGRAYAAGETVRALSENLSLYAQWEAVPIRVGFVDADGYTELCSPVYVTYGKPYGELPVPEKKAGYTFRRWCMPESGAAVDSGTVVAKAEDHVLKAEWMVDTYAVLYDFNFGYFGEDDGSGAAIDPDRGTSSSGKVVIYDSPYGELAAPSRKGYVFTGWYLSEDADGNGAGKRVDAETIVTEATLSPAVDSGGRHFLHAGWEAEGYRVWLDYNYDYSIWED